MNFVFGIGVISNLFNQVQEWSYIEEL
jgi:hypothetical protein